MNRRIAKKRQRIQLTVILSIILLSLLILMLMRLFSNTILAAPDIEQTYISVQIQKNDTLWGLATTYNCLEYYTHEEYIEQVIKINDLKTETLYTGSRLTLPVTPSYTAMKSD
ncbi:LysM peptidoglycan-binding domain-containing protein [Vallitaleaceae bacterium 9-2]